MVLKEAIMSAEKDNKLWFGPKAPEPSKTANRETENQTAKKGIFSETKMFYLQ